MCKSHHETGGCSGNGASKTSLKSLFKKANPLRDGLGGAVAAHIGCFALPIASSALGISLSSAFLGATMFIGAPILAAGLTYGLSRLRGQRATYRNLLISGALALVVSIGIHGLLGHQTSHDEAPFLGGYICTSDGLVPAPTPKQ